MIKEAKISDYDIISDIMQSSNNNSLLDEEIKVIREALTNYSKVVYIDYENEIPVAFAQCTLKEDDQLNQIGYLVQIHIKKNYKNKGIDKRLLSKCEEWAKNKGCNKFTASCSIDDTQKLDLYNYSGFSEINKVAYFSKNI